MGAEEIHETIHEVAGEDAEAKAPNRKGMAVYISFLAAVLAIASLGGSNAAKQMVNSNIQASDTFAFYQGKAVRQTEYQLAARTLELSVLSRADLTPEQRADVEREIAGYRATATRYESDPKTGEGKKELLAKARAFEVDRDLAAKQDPYFDAAEALLQLAIVLASVATVIEVGGLVWLSVACALTGVLATINGYTLLVDLPFL
ncbi:DUF4337 domain-containing protein [Azospirillum sp. TSO22-1]|uniref:DUF4337 domain-containing protein n=1 Tax=Azospirillum sp. TSO22-1 TaxID=716789 RepID=UPI000D603DB7|nr:DUF4337 domain-containing protein [Azospirillum sp. TSO22-1]PWC34982.1 hypothetical protein TSO221_30675 [Azospirillum sp. TSO22-1]